MYVYHDYKKFNYNASLTELGSIDFMRLFEPDSTDKYDQGCILLGMRNARIAQ